MGKAFDMVVDETGIGVVTLDMPGQALNTWSVEAFAGFKRLLKELEVAKGIRGVLFLSAKTEGFHAGADLKMLTAIGSEAEALQILEPFHQALDRLIALGIPTVAAIQGHCLGSGLEFALACTARIARQAETTCLGLPECRLGLLPGGGGTQRLPRLIGLAALRLILTGTTLAAAEALSLGIVDKLCPEAADLRAEALVFLEALIAGQADLRRPVPDLTGIAAAGEAALDEVREAQGGRELPGQRLALQSMQEGSALSLAEGLALERRLFGQALLTEEAREGLRRFSGQPCSAG